MSWNRAYSYARNDCSRLRCAESKPFFTRKRKHKRKVMSNPGIELSVEATGNPASCAKDSRSGNTRLIYLARR